MDQILNERKVFNQKKKFMAETTSMIRRDIQNYAYNMISFENWIK